MNPTSDSVPDPVVEKIKKLLRIGEGRGNSESEVEQALQAALRLSQRYGINLDEIDASEDIEPPEPVVTEDFTPGRTGGGTCVSRLPTSNRFIVMLLESYFRVRIIQTVDYGEYESKGEKRFGNINRLQLFGKQTNVQIAMYVYGFLHREFNLLWASYRKKTGCVLASRASYYLGLYTGLDHKLSETAGEVEMEVNKELGMNRVDEAGKPQTMALILKTEKETIDEKVKAAHPRLTYIKDRDSQNWHDYDALDAGKIAGKQIEIKTSLKKGSS